MFPAERLPEGMQKLLKQRHLYQEPFGLQHGSDELCQGRADSMAPQDLFGRLPCTHLGHSHARPVTNSTLLISEVCYFVLPNLIQTVSRGLFLCI